MKYTDKQINDLLKGIFEGTYDDRNMPLSLYTAIGEYLKKGVYDGFGGNLLDFEGKYLDNLIDLRENILLFSGAKTFQYTKDSAALLVDDEGKRRTWAEFKKLARPIYDLYNVEWLESEHITTIGQSDMAHQWRYIQQTKDTLPYLIYDAVIDPSTSEICRGFDGICLKADHPFWIRNSPLNHYRCRCIRRQAREGEITKAAVVNAAVKVADELRQPLFANNPGQSGEVFTKDHPYFSVSAKDKKFAKNNFGLPIPEKD